jgi:hypothetical protein
MAVPTGAFIFCGAISLKNIAIPMAIGIAKNIAIKVERTDPTIAGNPPKISILGAHLEDVIKFRPKASIAGFASTNKTPNMAIKITRSPNAENLVTL